MGAAKANPRSRQYVGSAPEAATGGPKVQARTEPYHWRFISSKTRDGEPITFGDGKIYTYKNGSMIRVR